MTAAAHRPSTTLAWLLGCTALLGCNQSPKQASLPRQAAAAQPQPLPLTTAAPAPSVPAPLGGALPAAPAVDLAYQHDPAEQYADADRAAVLADVLGDAPPDYSYDYDDGSRPWVWRGDGYVRLAEPTPDGERSYYYDAGSSVPYLVQDGGYGYGYANGILVAVYGPDGGVLSAQQARARLDLAGRYLARARNLYRAALSDRRQAVALQSWQDRRPAIRAQRGQWAEAQVRLGDWSAYHQAHQAQDKGRWTAERGRRAAEAQQYGPGPERAAPGPAIAPAPGGPLARPRPDAPFQRRPEPPPPPPASPPSRPSAQAARLAHGQGPGPEKPPSLPSAEPPHARAPEPTKPPPAQPAPPPVPHERDRPAAAAPLAAKRQAAAAPTRGPDPPPPAPRAAEQAAPGRAAPPAARPPAATSAAHAPTPKAPSHPDGAPRPARDDQGRKTHDDKTPPG